MENRLIAMKRSNKEPETGDVFVVQPEEGRYYYGKVINARVMSRNPSMDGWHLIFIYDACTNDIRKDVVLDRVPILIAPTVVNKRPWTMGYFVTIGRSRVTDYDLSIDYGFWDVLKKKYFDLQGDEMPHQPRYSDISGLGSYGSVAKAMHKALSAKRESSCS